MTKMMIRRIKKIDSYRIFREWKGDSVDNFVRVNVIYGQNGSGKSTLASLFQDCASTEARVSRPNIELEVETGGHCSTVTADDTAFWSRIRVFNKQFIERNLAFNGAQGPEPHSLLTVGEISVETEAELEKLRTCRDELKSKCDIEKEELTKIEKRLERRLSAVARCVVEDLRNSISPRYKATNIYNKKHVRQLLTGPRAMLDEASTDRSADRAVATSSTMDTPSLPVRGAMIGSDAVEISRRFLNTNIVVQVIDSFRAHPAQAEWAQKGILLHKDLDTCIFCGQSLTADRKEKLAAHFSTSLIDLQRDIKLLIDQLNESIVESSNYLDQLPDVGAVYHDLAEDLESARSQYKTQHDEYRRIVTLLIEALNSKCVDPFSNPHIDNDLTLSVPETNAIEGVVAKHEKMTARHQEDAIAAAHRVELSHVKEFVNEYEELVKERDEKECAVKGFETSLKNICNQIVSLENVEADPIPGEKELTACVARILGRDELRFTTTSDGKHYSIKREGTPAKNLSEGEQTAIALLYFLMSVRKDKVSGDEPIVIIDDPVSSLDNGILFGVSAHLWAELVVSTFSSQVFLMTHNFELFRQWLVQMESVPNGIRKKGGGYAAYEIRARYSDNCDEVRRFPEIRSWELDSDRSKKLRSQYHFLFSQVANALIMTQPGLGLAEQMEIMALMPNAARRMMESFLSFRCPEKMGSFHKSMRTIIDGSKNLDPAVRTHVERYLHAYSHLEDADMSCPLDPSESATVLRSLFKLISHVDRDHFVSMCKTLNIESEKLLAFPATTSQQEES